MNPEKNHDEIQNIGVKPVLIEDELKESFLDYAMSVVVSRAIPDIRDGLKPVHRRVLYTMHQLGFTYNKPYHKSVRVVGDVLGKYHPHGDQAVYQTMVNLVQDFSKRYPLLDGQGNWGSVDGDNAAAMRYTEVRMATFVLSSGVVQAHADCAIFPSQNGSCSNELVMPNNFKAYAQPDKLKLDPATEQFVRSVMRSIGIESKFTEIRRLSDWEIMMMGRKNAYVSKNFTGYKMVISQDWFNELTPGEKRFLTGHEAMHVRLGHCDRYLSPHNKVHMAISREQERHADLSSAVVLNCAQGGIHLFAGMKSRSFNAAGNGEQGDDPRDYYSHPELDERIEYLKPIADDQANGVTLNGMQFLPTIAMAA